MAQLGARFHGMEEVDGSNPSRSTKSQTKADTSDVSERGSARYFAQIGLADFTISMGSVPIALTRVRKEKSNL